MENRHIEHNRSGKVLAGIFIILVGIILLIRNVYELPHWVTNWSMILVALGIFIGLKTKFRNGSGLILILIGGIFTLKDALGKSFDFGSVWPFILVIFGIYLIFKPHGSFKKKAKWRNKFGQSDNTAFPEAETISFEEEKSRANMAGSSLDYLDSVNVFGGSHQNIFSKNFKGGEVVAVFGGCDINLSQADFEGEIAIDITAIFGGTKIIVPAGWQVKHEVTAIFGGLDDKRPIQSIVEGPKKLLVIKGIAMFGGVDIRSY